MKTFAIDAIAGWYPTLKFGFGWPLGLTKLKGSLRKMHALRCILFVSATLFAQQQLLAIPLLQVYMEGGVYNTDTESWDVTPVGSSGGVPFRLWVIANVDGPGSAGPIEDVRLAISYDEADLGLEITITPGLTNGFGGFTDPSLPFAPIQNFVINTSNGVVDTTSTANPGVITDGSKPVLGDGKKLPSHDEYGDGSVWQEYELGDFGLTDSPIGDFIGEFPTEIFQNAAQISVYEVSVISGSGATLHFDVYDHIQAENKVKAVFAPFSHDADGTANIIPEPSSVAIWSVFAAMSSIVHLVRRHRRTK